MKNHFCLLLAVSFLLSTTHIVPAVANGRQFNKKYRSMSPGGVSLPADENPRRACFFFLWDAPSALLSRWCNHLQKDCEYEGRGGDRFVRIRPGSILQLLYPCSRYARDRCLICGGKYTDHLSLWWYKHMYSPLDRMLDRDFGEGVLFPTPQKTNKRKSKTGHSHQEADFLRFAFHRRYVLDFSNIVQLNKSRPKSKIKTLLQREFEARYPTHKSSSQSASIVVDHPIHRLLNIVVPNLSSNGIKPSMIVVLVRECVVGKVISMMEMQEAERASLLSTR